MSTESYINQWRKKYKDINSVYCEAIDSTVFFTSEGFNHLIYKRGHRRSIKEIRYRLSLLKFATETLSISPTISEVRIQKVQIKGIIKDIMFIEINNVTGIYGNIKIAVIIKKTGNSSKWIFQSIMRKK